MRNMVPNIGMESKNGDYKYVCGSLNSSFIMVYAMLTTFMFFHSAHLFVNKFIRIIYIIDYDVMYKIVDTVYDGAEL